VTAEPNEEAEPKRRAKLIEVAQDWIEPTPIQSIQSIYSILFDGGTDRIQSKAGRSRRR
jgi:hypothetical protein